jgi:hypothetical protein
LFFCRQIIIPQPKGFLSWMDLRWLVLAFVAAVILPSASGSPQCLDENGRPVDWWYFTTPPRVCTCSVMFWSGS